MQLDTVLNCGQSGFLLVLVLVLEFPNNPSADENENEDEDEYVRIVSSCTPDKCSAFFFLFLFA